MVDVEDLIISVRTDESENDSRIGTTFHHFKTLYVCSHILLVCQNMNFPSVLIHNKTEYVSNEHF
jgi:hypothetical protein